MAAGSVVGLGFLGKPGLVLTVGLLPTGGSPTYETLLEALVGTLKTNLVSGTINGVYDRIPQTITLPYCVIYDITEVNNWVSLDSNSERPRYDELTIQISTFAGGRKAARQAADAVEAQLNDAALTFTDGTLLEIAQVARHAMIDPDRGVDGKPVWQEARTYLAMIERLF